MFEVQECAYQKNDPRYVIAVVANKDTSDFPAPTRESLHKDKPSDDIFRNNISETMSTLLEKIGSICNILETHEKRVSRFFNKSENSQAQQTVLNIDTELHEFTKLLGDVFVLTSDKDCQ